MPSKLFSQALAKVPTDTSIFVGKSMDIVERIYNIMENQNITQRDLAKKLNKSPSEINKWLTGSHNFTLKTISKLEAILEEEIILVKKKEEKTVTIDIKFTTFIAMKMVNNGLVAKDIATKPKFQSVAKSLKRDQNINSFLNETPNFVFAMNDNTFIPENC